MNNKDIRKSKKHRLTTSPGEMLWYEFIEPHLLEEGKLMTLWSPKEAASFINDETPVTPEVAKVLNQYTKMSEEFWLNLDYSYRQSLKDLTSVDIFNKNIDGYVRQVYKKFDKIYQIFDKIQKNIYFIKPLLIILAVLVWVWFFTHPF